MFDLINASPKFTDLFKECQVLTGDARQFKAGKPVEMCDRPMHRWESTLKFNSKLLKLALSIESFLAEVKERGWANNPNQSTIYPANWLSRKFPTPEFLLAIAIETDMLEVLVIFMKQTEYADNDPASVFEHIEDVVLDLKNLQNNKGENYRNVLKELASGRLSNWDRAGTDLKEGDWDVVYHETFELHLKQWEERFQDAQGKMNMFLLFSMREFRREVSNIGNAESFGDKYVDELSEFFCKQVKFTAQWEEARGEEFCTPALGEVKDLKSQCTSFRRFVFRNFMGKNPQTDSPWATKDVLVSLLTKDSPSWLKPNTILYCIMMSFFSMVTETADIERLMSIFCLQDTKLTQARAPARVEQMVLIHKESPSWNDFDSFTALLIWRSLKTRKVPLPPLPARLPTDKNWVKLPSQLKEAHNK